MAILISSSLVTSTAAIMLVSASVQLGPVAQPANANLATVGYENNSCTFSFNQDIYASYPQLTVKNENQELYRISHQGDLTINGETVVVTPEQRGMLIQYKNGITGQTEFVVEVMAEALEVTSYALTTVFSEMFGERHKIVRRIERVNQQLAADFALVSQQQGDTYIVQGSQLDAFGERLEATLETELEAIINDSMGSMIWMITKAMFSGKGSFEQRMEQFGERMEAMGAELETSMEAWGAAMEARATAMCAELDRLRGLESRIASDIPDFADMRLLK